MARRPLLPCNACFRPLPLQLQIWTSWLCDFGSRFDLVCIPGEKLLWKLVCIYEFRIWISMHLFWIKLNLLLLQENVEFSVGTDQNRWALSLPRYPICIAIGPNMVACEPKNINYIALKISWHSSKMIK